MEIKDYQHRYKLKAYRERPWLRYLHYAKSRCHSKAHRYTQRGIKCLLTEQDVKEIWLRDKPWLLNEPSLDRINGLKNYTKENCRFIELIQNKKQRDCKNYPKIRPWMWKAILQFDRNGEFIQRWESCIKAARILSILPTVINNNLRGLTSHSGGYIWKYAKQ